MTIIDMLITTLLVILFILVLLVIFEYESNIELLKNKVFWLEKDKDSYKNTVSSLWKERRNFIRKLNNNINFFKLSPSGFNIARYLLYNKDREFSSPLIAWHLEKITDFDYDNFLFIRMLKDASQLDKAIPIAYKELINAIEFHEFN